MPQVVPYLWFDGQAEQAAGFYTGIFPNSRTVEVARYPEGAPGVAGEVMTVAFELDGTSFVALNGGPQFQFTEAVSFVIPCRDQAEVDHYWERLTEGGSESQCGWLKDRFGVSWQVIPDELERLLGDPDPDRARRAMARMLTMGKLDIEELRRAADSVD